MEIININLNDYEEHEISCLKFSDNYTYDIEVEDNHHYILDNGIISHNTISYISEVSSGIEPVFSLGYTRKIELGGGEYREVFVGDKIFEKYIEENYPDKKNEILTDISKNNGSCQKNKYLSEKEKKMFLTARELTSMEHLDILEIFANNTSLSISKTVNLPKDCSLEDVSKVFIDAHKRGIIGVTVYRDGSREGILVDTSNKNQISKILKTNAPKRPKKLKADVYQVVVKHVKYYTVVGLYENEPYEIFCGLNYINGELYIDKSVKNGEIEKIQRGKYILRTEKGDYELNNGHSDDTVEALNRQISLSLRHGADISYVISSLLKTKGDMTSFSKVLARTLKHYIKDGMEVSGDECPTCKGKLIFEEGCKKCSICGISFCG